AICVALRTSCDNAARVAAFGLYRLSHVTHLIAAAGAAAATVVVARVEIYLAAVLRVEVAVSVLGRAGADRALAVARANLDRVRERTRHARLSRAAKRRIGDAHTAQLAWR